MSDHFYKIAQQMDEADPLTSFRSLFALSTKRPQIYLCNNSLGVPAVDTTTKLQEIVEQWREFGVEGWFNEQSNWYGSLDAPLRKPLADLLGAQYDEVIVMNTLTVNLHLLMASFYRPKVQRYKILIEGPCFPSDLYAMKSHCRFHGFDPEESLIIVEGKNHYLPIEDIEEVLESQGESIALVFLSCVNFLTGQVLDMQRISKKAKSTGCLVGFDLAHAAGNIPLKLHDWGVDFAVGCSYKYLCGGPGGPGIAFVHSSHHSADLPRFSGWWGNDPSKRFQMHLQPEFIPYGGAYSWQVSTPCILALAPLLASLGIFAQAGINNMRKKSLKQTTFLWELLDQIKSPEFEIITPKNPEERGCQLSILIHREAQGCVSRLERQSVIGDFRPPNILRVAPSPLYNSYQDLYHFQCKFSEALHC